MNRQKEKIKEKINISVAGQKKSWTKRFEAFN